MLRKAIFAIGLLAVCAAGDCEIEVGPGYVPVVYDYYYTPGYYYEPVYGCDYFCW